MSSNGRLPSLDGLRAVAILFVLAAHSLEGVQLTPNSSLERWSTGIQAFGEFGVQIFFVISGFLITHLLLKEHSKTQSINLGHFYVRRIFRIVPALYVLIATVGLLSVAGIFDASVRDIIHAATFTQVYNFHERSWYLLHTWSLCVEEQFYLFWPLALLILGPSKSRWLSLLIVAAVPGGTALETLAHQKFLTRLGFVLSVSRMDLLMYGCLAALLWPNIRCAVKNAPQKLLIAAISGAFLAVSIAALGAFWRPVSTTLAYRMFAPTLIGAGLVMAMANVVGNERSSVGELLNWKPLTWLGVLSYSIYLWQQLFCVPRPMGLLQRAPLNILFATTAGIASYYLVERPAIGLRIRLLRDRGASGPAI